MKTLFSILTITAILGLALASAVAQTETTTTSSNTTYIETSKLVGKPVKSPQGEQIGTVKDVVLDRSTGCMAYTVLSTGGGGAGVTGGGKMVAVPWAVYSPTSNISELTVTVDRQRIYNAPAFEYARIEEYSRPEYITNVYSYYGVSPGAAVGVGVSSSNTTTGTTNTTTTGAATGANTTGTATGANTTASTATSPAPGASAQGSPASNATEERRAHPGAAAAAGAAAVKARESATPSSYSRTNTPPSKERSPSAKQKQQTPSSRSGAERSETGGARSETQRPSSETERAPSEAASSGEKATGSQRHQKGKRETTSPSEKPPGGE